MELLPRKVDSPALQIRAQVAQDVRELERHAQVLRVYLPALLLVSEDAKADQPHHGGHAVAVALQLLEGRVAQMREIHLDAGEELFQVGARNAESLEMGAERARGGLPGLALVAGRDLVPPHLDLLPGAAGIGRFVHAVVDHAAERVHRADRFALIGRERAKGEVEVRAAGDRARVSHRFRRVP